MIALKKGCTKKKKNLYGSIQYVVVLSMVFKWYCHHEIKNDPSYFFSAHTSLVVNN